MKTAWGSDSPIRHTLGSSTQSACLLFLVDGGDFFLHLENVSI